MVCSLSMRGAHLDDRFADNRKKEMGKAKAVIVGGSIAGICCAHALIRAGWDVVVIEKTPQPPRGSPTGAGLGLDPFSQKIIESWIQQPQLLQQTTLPLLIDQATEAMPSDQWRTRILHKQVQLEMSVVRQYVKHWAQEVNQATDGETKVSRTLARDEHFNFRAAYWADLHSLLYSALPLDIVLWGYLFVSFSMYDDKSKVKVETKVLEMGITINIIADLLIAADGCLSSIRQSFLPDLKLRYSGYCAWRGVLDFSDKQHSEAIINLKKVYPDLGQCLYFDLSSGTHSVFYELLNHRFNWIWYINQPEPNLKGNSVTMKVSSNLVQNMHEEAEKTWVPELVRVIKEIKEPFLNVIYDCDPLEQIFWDKVVLIGDAAHPTTPHGLRSTNMSILDAAVLSKCLEKWQVENLNSALEEYQSIRLPVTTKQVLYSRRLGRIKQGLSFSDRPSFDPNTASPEDCEELQQKNMPHFYDIPSLLK